MISLDEQISYVEAESEFLAGCNSLAAHAAILLSLRRLKRIEELMREPSDEMKFQASALMRISSVKTERDVTALFSLLSTTLLKQVEEEVK
jgi:hypothetical protein